MFLTAEIRWFFLGTCPTAVIGWFKQLPGSYTIQSPRTDMYLNIPDTENLGIKLREGGLDIKQCHEPGIEYSFTDYVSGYLEQWSKWRFPLSELHSPLQLLTGEPSCWIPVNKKRRLYVYTVSSDNTVMPASNDPLPACGCGLELTNITCNDTQWWSIGFEAFGGGSSNTDILVNTIRHICRDMRVARLTTADSHGYPAWLKHNAQ
jgi:hypothetical protein